MTGLDATRDVIVEIATLVTDNDLNIVAEGPDIVVHQGEDALAGMDEVVRRMHTSSGLLDAIRASEVSLEEAGKATFDFLTAHIAAPRTVPLCGNSIGMDRRFLAAYLPDIEEFLHYRSIDVSTIKELARRWYPEEMSGLTKKASAHRAMDDIKESVAELRYWRERVFRPPTPADAPAGSPVAPTVPTAPDVPATPGGGAAG